MPKKLQEKSTHSVYDQDGYIDFSWKSAATAKEYKKIFEKFVDLVDKNRSNKIIFDNTKMGVAPDEAKEFFGSSIMPKLMGFGVKAMAIVESKSASVALSREMGTETIEQRLEQAGIKFRKFDNRSEAIDWIKQQ